MNLKDRILKFISVKGITVQVFEKESGLSNGAVSKMGDNTRRSTIDKISNAFPDINRDWLLTGNGEMLKPDRRDLSPNARLVGGVYSAGQKDDGVAMVDFVPVSATASFIESLSGDSDSDFDKYPLIPKGNEGDNIESLKIFEVDGDSMFPTISSGSLILAKIIPEKSWHYAEGVVVAVFSEYVVVKRVARNCLLTENYIILRSDNEDYGEMNVALADLRALYKAKRIISSEIR